MLLQDSRATPLLYPHLFGECFLAQTQSKMAPLPGKTDSQINNAALMNNADISFHSQLFSDF